jgi:hypothetical protein
MSQPTDYTPSNSFASFAPAGFANLGVNLDTEFGDIETTLDEILTNLAILQRDDTALANGIVTTDSLSTQVLQLLGTTGWEPKGAWLTGTSYVLKDVVSQSGTGYVCIVAHTSGTFNTDLSAAKWAPFTTASSATAFGNTLIAAADATAALTVLGLTVTTFAKTYLDDADAATTRTTLGAEQKLSAVAVETSLALTDRIAIVDVSEADATNTMTVSNVMSQAISLATDTTPTGADQTAYELLARKISDGTLHRFLPSEIGVGKQSMWIPAGAMTARTTNGAASGTSETTTNKVMLKSLDFDASTDEFAQFMVNMPKGWNESTVTAIFVWSHAATTTNFTVIWGIQGLALSNDDAADAAFGSAVTVTDIGGTTNDIYRSDESGAITIGGTPAENDVVVFQVYRDADAGGDTMAIDARLHGVLLFYTTNANTDN